MSFLTISTDFGIKDGNTGVMKGVIYTICPQAKIVDITHMIEPQNIRQAAYVLSRQVFFFPENTVHVVVVDPGVGTVRRPIAAQVGPQRFVGPDNGFLTLIYKKAEKEGWPIKVVHTHKPEYWLQDVSDIFHGRDIFSPVGAHLAAGVPLEELGTVIDDPVRIDLPRVRRDGNSVVGEIVHIDHFGNMISNIRREDLVHLAQANVDLEGYTFSGISRTFGEKPVGALMSLFCSYGYLMVSKNQGSAYSEIQKERGTEIRVVPAG